jgi:hypothetical protein
VRESSDGTIGEAITSAVSACRWLYRKEKAPGVPQIIRRYMDWRNTYQAKAVRMRSQNDVDELQEQNKWLEWTDFTALVEKLRREWNECVVQDEPNFAAAQTLHDLLLLGLYSCIPARGAEVRLLQYIPEEMVKMQMALTLSKKKPQTFKVFVEKQEINLITRVDGIWKMILSQFKNVRQRGVDTTELTAFGWWIELFQLYQKTYRPLLLGTQHKHDFVFVARQGTPFTANYFSDFLSTLLHRHTGQRVATNILRSSFVTHFYGTEDAQNPVIRESVASVMRHTVDQALRVYDRRSSAAKKHKGLLASKQDVAPATAATAIVVLFQRMPHQIIQEDGPRLLLGRMTRSPTSNAPIFHLPPETEYQWHPRTECDVMNGEWQEDGDFLVTKAK